MSSIFARLAPFAAPIMLGSAFVLVTGTVMVAKHNDYTTRKAVLTSTLETDLKDLVIEDELDQLTRHGHGSFSEAKNVARPGGPHEDTSLVCADGPLGTTTFFMTEGEASNDFHEVEITHRPWLEEVRTVCSYAYKQ